MLSVPNLIFLALLHQLLLNHKSENTPVLEFCFFFFFFLAFSNKSSVGKEMLIYFFFFLCENLNFIHIFEGLQNLLSIQCQGFCRIYIVKSATLKNIPQQTSTSPLYWHPRIFVLSLKFASRVRYIINPHLQIFPAIITILVNLK